MNRSGVARPSDSCTDAGHGGRLGGIVAAVLTPCRAAGEPDTQAMIELCRQLVRAGCDGLFVISSTGEMPMLDGQVRQALIAAAREGAGGAALYAGISGTGLAQTIRYAHEAAAAGADVAIAMPPFFLKLDQRELLSYFTAIADASPIPVGLYHHLRMPSPIEPETVARLAEHGNVVVMKDTSADVQRVRTMSASCASLALMQGREPLLLASLEAGAAGCVTALAGVAPEWHRDLFDAWQAGHMEAARQAQQRIDDLAELFTLPQVARSFAHFAYTLRRSAWRRGWLKCTAGMIPGFAAEPAFDEAIDKLLDRVGLPMAAAASAKRE